MAFYFSQLVWRHSWRWSCKFCNSSIEHSFLFTLAEEL